MTRDGPKNPVKAVRTTFRILETLEDQDGLRLTPLAKELGVAKSTAHRYLTTLESMGYLIRKGDTYYLSHRFIHFATHVRTRDERTEEHGRAVYVTQAVGEQGVKIDTKTGKQDPIHTTAAGKAILSTWPEREVAEFVGAHGLAGPTPHSITDREALFRELAEVRDHGYAINDQENVPGLKAVSVPILAEDDEALGAISVSGPTNRMQGEWFDEELPTLLLGVSNELQLNFRFQNDGSWSN